MAAADERRAEPTAERAADAAPLAHWRTVDWRFLLGGPVPRRVGLVPAPAPDEAAVLAEAGVMVTDPSVTADTVLLRMHRPWRVALRGHPSRSPAVRRLRPASLTVYWHAPSRERCSYLVDLDDRVAVATMLRRYHGVRLGRAKSLVARALNSLGRVHLLARDVTVVAGPPAPGRGATAELLVTPWFEASRHVVCLTLDRATGELTEVTKLPRRPWDTAGIRHEAAVLEELERRTSDLRGRVPHVLELSVGPRACLRETAVAGVAVGPELVRRDPARVVEAGLHFVEGLPRTGSTLDRPEWFSELVERPLLESAAAVPLPDLPALVADTLELLAGLRTATLPLVLEHGDLGHPNLVLDRAGRLGAVDWERAQVHGLPGHDLFFLLQYVAESRRSTFERSGQLAAFDETFVGARTWISHRVFGHLASLGVPAGLAPALLLVTFARSSAGLVRRLSPAGSSGAQTPTELVATFADDRDFALWRHAVDRYDRLLR